MREYVRARGVDAKGELLKANGRIYREDLFAEASWLQVLHGHAMTLRGYHPMADRISNAELSRFLSDLAAHRN